MNINEDDRDLLIGCCKGDRRAQNEFITRFSNLVYNTVLNTFRTKGVRHQAQDIEDLHQTVLMQLLEKRCKRLRQFQGKNGCSLNSWIRMIAMRTVIDHLRSRKDALAHTNKLMPDDVLHQLQADPVDPVHMMDQTRQMHRVHEVLSSLLPRDRLFIKLHCLKELSIHEVAGILKISTNNAYCIKHRAMQRLKVAWRSFGRETEHMEDQRV